MNSSSRRLVWGAALLGLAYMAMAISPLLALIYKNDASVQHKLAPDISLVAIALILVELMIVAGPLRKGAKWAAWAAILPFVVIGIPRLLTDSACQLSDLHHHGCHQFMGAMALGAIGFLMSASDIFLKQKTQVANA